jgi:tetratricopeptide (TPR) repeat protein
MVNLPAVLFALAIPIAYLDATAPDRMRTPRRFALPPALHGPTWRALAGATGVAVTALALAGVALQELPARDAAFAVSEANAGRWDNARQPALSAATADPAMTSYLFTAGLAQAHAGNHAAAADLFRRVATAVDLPEAWLNLAAEDLEAGRPTAVSASLQAALRLGRQRPAVAMAAGDLALRIGNEAMAIDAFTAAAAISPSILADSWWGDDAARRAIHGAVSNAALSSVGPERAWEVALMSGDAAGAANFAPDDARRDFVRAWEGDEAARVRLTATCEAQPLNIGVLLLCARAEGRAGNLERANEFRYLANVQIGGAYSLGAELRVNDQQAVGRSLEGDPAIFWGTYTYRRPTPWDVLVPSLVHLTLE